MRRRIIIGLIYRTAGTGDAPGLRGLAEPGGESLRGG